MSFLRLFKVAQPSAPAANSLRLYRNSTDGLLHVIDDNSYDRALAAALWFNVADYQISPANSAATNVTNLNNLLQNIAPTGSVIQFGPGTYQFNAGLTALTKDFAFLGIRGMTTIAITAAMGTNTPFLTFNPSGFYTSLRDLNFVNFATQTSNYVIECGNNANVEIADCFFTGASNWAGIIDFTGTSSGVGAVIKNFYASNFAGSAINIASSLSSLYMSDLEILGGNVATSVGISVTNGGASTIIDSQIIKCNINLELAPTTGNTVSAMYIVNSFFDQGVTNALLITGAGTGTVARCHFIGCWFTAGSTGTSPNCVQISTSGSAVHSGISFEGCMISNATTGSTGTLTGINATSVADLTITGCQIAGWTTGISITPASAGTCILNIQNNIIGASGLIPANTLGIQLNAGSVAYGQINIQGNNFNGNTTNITDASTLGTTTAATGQKVIQANLGLVVAPPANYTATTIPLTTVTNVDSRGGVFIPIGAGNGSGSFRGLSIRITVLATNSATAQTLTATVRYGTNNSSSDTAIFTQAFTAGTAAAGSGKFEFDVEIPTSTTAMVTMQFYNGNNTTTGIAGVASLFAALSTLATISTTANNWLGIYFSSATASAITIRSVKYEIQSQ